MRWMRPPSAPPKMTKKRSAVRTGGRMVCVHSESTRRLSRPASARVPRRCKTGSAAAGGELFRRSLVDDPALLNEGDPLAECLRLLDVMRREQDRQPLVGVHA